MSIKQQTDDARFLVQNHRHLGALSLLILAVAGSSRKVFPHRTKSFRKNPNDDMRDGEAFERFLSGRLQQILFGAGPGFYTDSSGLNVTYKNQSLDICHILYKFYRCNLVYEGALPNNIRFEYFSDDASKPPEQNFVYSLNGVKFQVEGDDLILDHNWIGLLAQVVIEAICNKDEFGIKYYKLVPNAGNDEENLSKEFLDTFQIDRGRLPILKLAVQLITPEIIKKSRDLELRTLFLDRVQTGEINGGAITGLRGRNLTDQAGTPTDTGLQALRAVAEAYQLIEY